MATTKTLEGRIPLTKVLVDTLGVKDHFYVETVETRRLCALIRAQALGEIVLKCWKQSVQRDGADRTGRKVLVLTEGDNYDAIETFEVQEHKLDEVFAVYAEDNPVPVYKEPLRFF